MIDECCWPVSADEIGGVSQQCIAAACSPILCPFYSRLSSCVKRLGFHAGRWHCALCQLSAGYTGARRKLLLRLVKLCLTHKRRSSSFVIIANRNPVVTYTYFTMIRTYGDETDE